MLAFLMGAFSWGRRIAFPFVMRNWKYFAIGAGIVLLYIMWQRDRTRQYEKGQADTVTTIEQKYQKLYEAKWRVVEKGLKEDKEKAQKEWNSAVEANKILKLKETDLAKANNAIQDALQQMIMLSKVQAEAGYEAGKNLNSSNVDNFIRQLSRELEVDRSRSTTNTIINPK